MPQAGALCPSVWPGLYKDSRGVEEEWESGRGGWAQSRTRLVNKLAARK